MKHAVVIVVVITAFIIWLSLFSGPAQMPQPAVALRLSRPDAPVPEVQQAPAPLGLAAVEVNAAASTPPVEDESCAQLELSYAERSEQLRALSEQIRAPLAGKPLDWQLLTLLHPTPLLNHPPLLRLLIHPPNEQAGFNQLVGYLLSHWIVGLSDDPDVLPAGYRSAAEFLEAPMGQGLAVKHLFVGAASRLPAEQYYALLTQVSWSAEDIEKIQLKQVDSAAWPIIFNVIPGFSVWLADRLVEQAAGAYGVVLTDPVGLRAGWSKLMPHWPTDTPPSWRWPLPAAMDLVLAAGPDASEQLWHWQAQGLPNSLRHPGDTAITLPLWRGRAALGQYWPQMPPLEPGWDARQPQHSYSADELAESAQVREQLMPLLQAFNQHADSWQQAEQHCQQSAEARNQQAAAWYWSLTQQGLGPLQALGLDCANVADLDAIASFDSGAAEYCFAKQDGFAFAHPGWSLDDFSWLRWADEARRADDLALLLEHVENEEQMHTVVGLLVYYLPTMLPQLLDSGWQPNRAQLSMLDNTAAQQLLEAGYDFTPEAGVESIYWFLAQAGELDRETAEQLQRRGVEDYPLRWRRDSLDLLLEQAIRSPRLSYQQLEVVLLMHRQLPLRNSHIRRMAVLRERNPIFYQQLIAQAPELTAAPDIPTLFYGL